MTPEEKRKYHEKKKEEARQKRLEKDRIRKRDERQRKALMGPPKVLKKRGPKVKPPGAPRQKTKNFSLDGDSLGILKDFALYGYKSESNFVQETLKVMRNLKDRKMLGQIIDMSSWPKPQ